LKQNRRAKPISAFPFFISKIDAPPWGIQYRFEQSTDSIVSVVGFAFLFGVFADPGRSQCFSSRSPPMYLAQSQVRLFQQVEQECLCSMKYGCCTLLFLNRRISTLSSSWSSHSCSIGLNLGLNGGKKGLDSLATVIAHWEPTTKHQLHRTLQWR